MSIIVDNVRAWEADIDRITRGPLASFQAAASAAVAAAVSERGYDRDDDVGGIGSDMDEEEAETAQVREAGFAAALSSPYVDELLKIVKSLSANSSAQPILGASQVRHLLQHSGLLDTAKQLEQAEGGARGSLEDDAERIDIRVGGIDREGGSRDSSISSSSGSGGISGLPTVPGQGLNYDAEKSFLASEVEWLLVSKATVQVYGILLNTLLEQIIPLHDDIWYWDGILASYTSLSLYTMQTSPLRFWRWVQDMRQVLGKSRARWTAMRQHHASEAQTAAAHGAASGREAREAGASRPASLAQQWQQFYGIVRRVTTARSLADLERRLLSPMARCRADARHSQKRLKQLRKLIASGLGILIDEGLRFDIDDISDSGSTADGADAGGGGVGVGVGGASLSASAAALKEITADNGRRWKGVVERSVSLMDQVTMGVLAVESSIPDFEDRVFNGVQGDPILTTDQRFEANKPAHLAQRLDLLLSRGIPDLVGNLRGEVAHYGQPSPLLRYWLPAGVLLLSSSTILRVLSNHRADLADWVRGLGTTVRSFWFNWVIEPVTRIIGTIRHDQNSEIAIMSRDSLQADRDSLERMVVDFALERPGLARGDGGMAGSHETAAAAAATTAVALSDAEVAAIRAKVREGDVTPVLRAYESGLRRPLRGAVRGDLVRSLLIQVQKTKVDLEVAISGIDALLKSQELVFGFVGLTPGVLVSVAALQYLRAVLGGRAGLQRGRRAGRCVRVLRNMDRLFCDAATDAATLNGILSYKHRGLLVCEVHVLRSLASGSGLFPSDVEKEFLEDVDEVLNAKSVDRQRQALERVRWAYGRWLRLA